MTTIQVQDWMQLQHYLSSTMIVPIKQLRFGLILSSATKMAISFQLSKILYANVFSLEKNYPNPFNPTTTIEYSIGIAGPAKLMIYDILGREVVSLVNEYKQVGRHKVMWNASTMSSGVYFYRLKHQLYQNSKNDFNEINFH